MKCNDWFPDCVKIIYIMKRWFWSACRYIEFGPNVKCCCGAPNCRGAIGERFNSNRVKSRCSEFCIKWGFQQKRSSLLTQSPPLFDGLRTQKKQQSAWWTSQWQTPWCAVVKCTHSLWSATIDQVKPVSHA